MKKFEGMLFCTDLDGTLYRDDKTLSRENREAIDYFKAEGGRFTFITGRVPATSREIYRAIRPNAPYGCINGAAIYDGEKEEYLDRLFLAEEALELVQQVDRELGDVLLLFNLYVLQFFATPGCNFFAFLMSGNLSDFSIAR